MLLVPHDRKKSERNWVQLQIANEDYLLLSHSSSGVCFDKKVHFPENFSLHRTASAWKEINSLFSEYCLRQTASSGFAAVCLWHLLCAKLFFIFQKIYKSTITSHKAWKNWSTILSLFSERIRIHHHSRQEWHHESHPLHYSFWQI